MDDAINLFLDYCNKSSNCPDRNCWWESGMDKHTKWCNRAMRPKLSLGSSYKGWKINAREATGLDFSEVYLPRFWFGIRAMYIDATKQYSGSYRVRDLKSLSIHYRIIVALTITIYPFGTNRDSRVSIFFIDFAFKKALAKKRAIHNMISYHNDVGTGLTRELTLALNTALIWPKIIFNYIDSCSK